MAEERNQVGSEIDKQEQEFFAAWAKVRQQGTESNFKLAHQMGMSATQFALLRLLEKAQGHEPCTISLLAGQMDLDPATVVRSVDILEKRGLVERRRNTQDRRQVFVEFTREGHEVQQAHHQRFTNRLSTVFRSMSPVGRVALLQGLREFLTIGQEMEESADSPSP